MSVNRVKGAAQLVGCKSNERQMGIALMAYVQDGAFYPGMISNDLVNSNRYRLWFQSLERYTRSTWTQPLYDCPGFHFDRGVLSRTFFSGSTEQHERASLRL